MRFNYIKFIIINYFNIVNEFMIMIFIKRLHHFYYHMI